MSTRAIAPIIGVISMLVVVTALGGVVAAVLPASLDQSTIEPVSTEVSFEAEDGTLVFYHAGGSTIDVNDLRIEIRVNDEPLRYQPTVPTNGETGFGNFHGPFHAWSSQQWYPGDTAEIEIASENEPTIEPGDRFTVYLFIDEQLVAEMSTRVSD